MLGPVGGAYPHGIDAVGEPAIGRQANVGGRVAEVAAAPLAVDDRADDEPAVAEEAVGAGDVALAQCLADVGRGEQRPVGIADRLHHLDREAQPLAGRAEHDPAFPNGPCRNGSRIRPPPP